MSRVTRYNGVQHTLTVWRSKEDMKRFLTSGAHLNAMKAFRSIATGKTFGYESDKVPSWEEVHKIWLTQAKTY